MTSSVDIYNQLAAYWGILPMMAPQAEDETTMIRAVLSLVRDRGLAKPGQHVILTMAIPFRSGLPTNTIQIHPRRIVPRSPASFRA